MSGRLGLAIVVVALGGCIREPATTPAPAAPSTAARTDPPSPPTLEPARPVGVPRCAPLPAGYPDADHAPDVAPLAAIAGLRPDPGFVRWGVPDLVSFATQHLVVHVSIGADPVYVACAVLAADDAVAFVDATLGARRPSDDDAPRDLFLLDPRSAPGILGKLDPDRKLGTAEMSGRFAAVTDPESPLAGIVQFREVRPSYLQIGFDVAHERVHVLQRALAPDAPRPPPLVLEGEANLLAARWEDAVVPGYATLFWDRDARRIEQAWAAHPELGPRSFFEQRAHEHHDEITLFSFATRGLDDAGRWAIHARRERDRGSYADAFLALAGRPLVDRDLEDVARSPRKAPRTPIAPQPLAARVMVEERGLRVIATGFAPRETIERSIKSPTGESATPVQADDRGVVAWGAEFRPSGAWSPRDVTLRAASGVVTARYFDRDGS